MFPDTQPESPVSHQGQRKRYPHLVPMLSAWRTSPSVKLCHHDAMLHPPSDEANKTASPRSPQPERRRQSPEKGGSTEFASQPAAGNSPKVDPAVKEWIDKVLVPAMVRIYLAGNRPRSSTPVMAAATVAQKGR